MAKTYEKVPNITDHKRNANQDNSKISPNTCQNDYYKKETSAVIVYHWWECKLQKTAIVENKMEIPQNLKIDLLCDPAFHFWVYIQRK